MVFRPLRYFGDPVLKTPCKAVTEFDAGLKSLITDLLETVDAPGRAGLAAPQIGVGLRAFSYNVDEQIGYVINPEVVETPWRNRMSRRVACRCRACTTPPDAPGGPRSQAWTGTTIRSRWRERA